MEKCIVDIDSYFNIESTIKIMAEQDSSFCL